MMFRSAEKMCAGSILLFVVYTAWARSGIYGPWFAPIGVFFVLALVCFLVSLTRSEKSVRRRLVRDPILWFGGLLCLLLLVQWLNAGGQLFFNLFSGAYGYTPPPAPGWPFSIDATESWQPLGWFAPAVLMALAVRHVLSRATLKWLLSGLLWNGALLAIFGMIQFSLGWTKMFGVIEMPPWTKIVSTFPYTNHGGAYFYLMFALALGLLGDSFERHRPWWNGALPGLVAVLLAGAAFCSLSRAAVFAVGMILVWAFAWWAWMHRRSFSVGGWVNLFLAGCAVGVVLFFLVIHVGQGTLSGELASRSLFKRDFAEYGVQRGFQLSPALEMFKDHPLFGVGGWGYRHFARFYLPREQWGLLDVGKANVHCDPVQFLAEHGLIGLGAMAVGVMLMAMRWRPLFGGRNRMLPLATGLGCLMVFGHSWVDPTFRCPTVLWHWLLLVLIVPQLVRKARLSGEDCAKEPAMDARGVVVKEMQ